MKLVQENPNIGEYLKNSDIVDYEDEEIERIVNALAKGIDNEIELTKKIYEYVRDNISHSFDINGKIVTCTAPEVLRFKEGICFAKSHLLAALLRCLGIPTGFCYQKLVFSESDCRLVLHGLNAICLKSVNKWVRVDARGNKEGINAEFSTGDEKLAFPVRKKLGEIDYPIIYAEPNKNVVNALRNNKTLERLIGNPPLEL